MTINVYSYTHNVICTFHMLYLITLYWNLYVKMHIIKNSVINNNVRNVLNIICYHVQMDLESKSFRHSLRVMTLNRLNNNSGQYINVILNIIITIYFE